MYDTLVSELKSLASDFEKMLENTEDYHNCFECFQQLYALSFDVGKNGIKSNFTDEPSDEDNDDVRLYFDGLVNTLSRLADECKIRIVSSRLEMLRSKLIEEGLKDE